LPRENPRGVEQRGAALAHGAEPQLWCLPYSPWSEKACWALELQGVAYQRKVYQPLLGELQLRRLLGKLRGTVSVPVLVTSSGPISDSLAIARYAAAKGQEQARKNRLFPPEHEAQIARYNALSESGLAAGRALALQRLLQDPAGLSELVPRKLRGALGGLTPKLGAVGIKRTLRKYGADRVSDEAHERALASALDALRADLQRSPSRSEPKTLLTELSYADIAMAQVLAFVEPPKTGLRLAPATREAFRDPVFGPRYTDLLAWRDALYEHYRKVPHAS
jgi:glutathione S-transferase